MSSEHPIPALPVDQPRAPAARSRRFATLRSVAALMLREMVSRYGRNAGGYAWAVIEPLGGIVILSIGFQLVLRAPSLGTSFLLFYATGYLVFDMFNKLAFVVARSLGFSRNLLTYPAVTWFDAVAARFALNALTGLMIVFLILGGVLIFEDTNATLSAGPILYAFGLAMLLGLGVGSVNCVLFGFFPVWSSVWSILTRPLFLASGVLFIYEDLPLATQTILWFNPLLHLSGILRSGFYPMYAPSYVSHAFVFFVGLSLTGLGFMLLHRFHREILDT